AADLDDASTRRAPFGQAVEGARLGLGEPTVDAVEALEHGLEGRTVERGCHHRRRNDHCGWRPRAKTAAYYLVGGNNRLTGGHNARGQRSRGWGANRPTGRR